MSFVFSYNKRVPISEATRKLWKKQAEQKLEEAVKLSNTYTFDGKCVGDILFEEALQLERDSHC